MIKENKVPNRIAQPEDIDYILLDKKSFGELMTNFEAAIEGQSGKKQEIGIRVDGFGGAFRDTEAFTGTLTSKEWKSLSSIRVSFNDKGEYADRLSLSFGNYSFRRAALRIEYGSGNTDIERLAIKEKIDVFITDYRRSIWLADRVLSSIIAILAFIGFTYWLYTSLSAEKLAKLTAWNHLNAMAAAVGLSWIMYILTGFIHHKIFPFLETVEDRSKTKSKKIAQLIGGIIAAIGVISGIIAIAQWIF